MAQATAVADTISRAKTISSVASAGLSSLCNLYIIGLHKCESSDLENYFENSKKSSKNEAKSFVRFTIFPCSTIANINNGKETSRIAQGRSG